MTTAVLEGLGSRAGDADLSVVQFPTAFCGPCRGPVPGPAASGASGGEDGVLRAESSLDAVRELDVRRTPTLFYLDREGRLLGRRSGAPRPQELTALVDAHTGVRS